jgi:hypothetical protein
MLSFSVCWNSRRLAWRRHSERTPWQLEAILCERMLFGDRPALRIVGRLAGIREDEIDIATSRDQFWHDARRKLGKLHRLSPKAAGPESAWGRPSAAHRSSSSLRCGGRTRLVCHCANSISASAWLDTPTRRCQRDGQ